MKPSRVGRRAARGGRHAVRAVARRPIPVAVVGLAAATVLGLGAMASAGPDRTGEFERLGMPFESHQFDRHFDPHHHQFGNWRPEGHHR